MIELKDKLIGFDDEDFVGNTKKPIKILKSGNKIRSNHPMLSNEVENMIFCLCVERYIKYIDKQNNLDIQPAKLITLAQDYVDIQKNIHKDTQQDINEEFFLRIYNEAEDAIYDLVNKGLLVQENIDKTHLDFLLDNTMYRPSELVLYYFNDFVIDLAL